jgi:hypothetical protein
MAWQAEFQIHANFRLEDVVRFKLDPDLFDIKITGLRDSQPIRYPDIQLR